MVQNEGGKLILNNNKDNNQKERKKKKEKKKKGINWIDVVEQKELVVKQIEIPKISQDNNDKDMNEIQEEQQKQAEKLIQEEQQKPEEKLIQEIIQNDINIDDENTLYTLLSEPGYILRMIQYLKKKIKTYKIKITRGVDAAIDYLIKEYNKPESLKQKDSQRCKTRKKPSLQKIQIVDKNQLRETYRKKIQNMNNEDEQKYTTILYRLHTLEKVRLNKDLKTLIDTVEQQRSECEEQKNSLLNQQKEIIKKNNNNFFEIKKTRKTTTSLNGLKLKLIHLIIR